MKQNGIMLAPTVLPAVEEHCFSDLSGEVGGFLVGRLSDDSVELTASYPALAATAGQAHVTFTHEVWSDILPIVERDHPGESIVGWYHSHPGFGLFLSEYDSFIQQNFFGDPRQVALVVDPLAGELGWFVWNGTQVVELGRRATATAAARDAAAKASGATSTRSGGVSWRSIAVPAIAALAIAFAGGYLVAQRSTPEASASVPTSTPSPTGPAPTATGPSAGSTAALKDQIAALTAQVEALKSKRAVVIRYRARSGDTLWRLAEIAYGDGAQYPRIEAANPGLRERGLFAGTTVLIPIGGE